jgi:hypothetical protein
MATRKDPLEHNKDPLQRKMSPHVGIDQTRQYFLITPFRCAPGREEQRMTSIQKRFHFTSRCIKEEEKS